MVVVMDDTVIGKVGFGVDVHTFAAKAMHLDVNRSLSEVCAVIMQNLHFSIKARRPSTFSFRDGFSVFFSLYGSADLSLGVWVLLKVDMILTVGVSCFVEVKALESVKSVLACISQ
jgi:hypothetical protein